MLPTAQGNALGKRRPRLIHSAFLRLRKNATRRKRVTHYALNATRGVAPHKAGCSYRARHFNQCNIVPSGRCPGLSAAIGLTARHNCAANAVKSYIYMNDCVKPNEQNRVYSNFAMASNRTFKNSIMVLILACYFTSTRLPSTIYTPRGRLPEEERRMPERV